MHNVYYVVDECHEARNKLRFLSEFLSKFCLNHSQELLLLCFIGFAGKKHCIALGCLYTKSSRRSRCRKPLRLYVTLYVASNVLPD